MAISLDRLINQLNTSPTAKGDQPLWQVITQLIRKIKELEAVVNATSSVNQVITNLTEQTFIIQSGDDGGGGDGEIGPPGSQGMQGVAGATGPAGPPTIGPMGIDGTDGDDGFPIPGPQGIQGAMGNTGPVGPPTIGPMGLDGEDGLDAYPIPGLPGATGSSATADWALVTSRVCTGNPTEDFTGLAGYNEILVIVDNITRSVSGLTSLRVSIDNGVSFLSAAGDYVDVSVAGVEAAAALMAFHTTNATLARSGRIHIVLFDTASVVKNAMSWDGNNFFIPTANALNAIRVYSGAAGGNLTGGTIFVYGR